MAQIVNLADRSWLAEGMRLSAFFRPGADLKPETLEAWWKKVLGSEPESKTSEQHGLRSRFKGNVLGGTLELSATPSRLDWKLTALPQEPVEAPATEVFALGPFEEVKSQFLSIAESWLGLSPALRRMALGMTLVHQVADKSAAMEVLQARIGRPCLDLADTTELVYRVNRQRSYNLDANKQIQINRLHTWSAVTYMGLIGTIDVQEQGMQAFGIPSAVAAQLELDLNTAPGNTIELPQGTLVPLLKHLAELGTEIAAKGDIP